jgi:AraC family transcriptional regulator of adaptative response / DNA-3-methyladenine glycosylase II
VGITKARAETIRTLARAVCDRRIRFEGIVETDAFLAGLCEISGIGTWTAQYVAMRALGEPDAFPAGDLGLLRALNLKSSRELERRSEAWRPWRAYATMYLWNGFGENKFRGSKAASSRIQTADVGNIEPRNSVSSVA